MRFLALLLTGAAALAVAFAAPARYGRLGDFEGKVEVQLTPASAWIAAERNLPLPESAWVRTGAGARAEIELDDGGSWRLGPDSQGGLSDYTTLSTGQRITLIAIDRGLAYVNGQNRGRDSVAVAMPGAQLFIQNAVQLRIEAGMPYSQVYVLQGSVNFSSPAAAIDLGRRQTARVEPDKPTRFFLDREFQDIELDKWNAARVKALGSAVSAVHVRQRYGVADLDGAGEWIQTGDWGLVWKPAVPATWIPFANGRWRWLDRLGYTWVSDDAWGWLPYHYGRWARLDDGSWVWSPSASDVFHPGEVYWMRAAKLAGWGPLAPGEDWQPAVLPRWYLDAYTTFAAFATDMEVIDPAGFDGRPKEPLRTAGFTTAMPSPAFPAARLEMVRPEVRANVLSASVEMIEAPPPPPRPVKTETPKPPPAQVIVVTAPPPPPDEVYVPVPVFEAAVIYSPILQVMPDKLAPGEPGGGSHAVAKLSPPAGRPPAQAGPQRPKRAHDRAEGALANTVFEDMRAHQWTKAMDELDKWSKRYPDSDYADDRLYYQAQTSHYLKESAAVLEYGASVMAKGDKAHLDSRQMLDLTYLVATESAGMNRLTGQQMALAKASAQSLFDMAGQYYADGNRPAGIRQEEWKQRRETLQDSGRAIIKSLGAARGVRR